MRRQPSLGLLPIAVLSVLAVMILGCSSSKKTTPKLSNSTNSGVRVATASAQAAATIAATATPTVTPPTVAAATASAQASTGGLSGTWSGQYSGAFQGTFKLIWQQSGANLSGTIALSLPPVTLPVTGTLEGSTIRFGTVGSAAITYTGSVSGNSMSGTYQTGATAATGGSWSATKSP